ncbi:MAG: STAS domain-containing protein [Chloroflexi bacterium]|nr:STAS domain-containing protein [Chloroflexota bacterium]
MSRRQVVTALLIAQLVGAAFVTAGQALKDARDPVILAGIVAILLTGVLLAAYLRGWEAARAVNIVIVTATVGIATPDLFVRELSALIVLVPPAIAQVLAGPRWIAGSALGILAIMTLRAGPQAGFLTSYTNDVRTLASFIVIVLGMVLSRVVADTALRSATANGQRAEEALARADVQAVELQERARTLREQNQRQQELLNLVAELETPAVTLAEGVLLAPIVGPIDDRRAGAFAARLLQHASEQRARLVVRDVAGAANVNGNAALALARVVQALRLIGCQVAISGISADVARTLASNGVSFSGAITVRTPREALELYRAGA